MIFIDIIGWTGTILMLLGSIINIYKHTLCWPVWIVAGICLIYQAVLLDTWNIAALQLIYLPLNIYGWKQWSSH